MRNETARVAALLSLLAAATVGCSTEGPTATGINELPENRGTEINTSEDAYIAAEVTWSADGNELYFQTNGVPGQLAAVSLTGQTRFLDGPRDGYYDVVPSSDGTSLYFAADRQGGVRSVYRLPLNGGSIETLTSRASSTIAAAPADGRLAQPSPDGKRVAFASLPDTIFTYTVATGARDFVGTGCERVVDWSPDQSMLLCQTGVEGNGVFRTMEIATGVTEIVEIVPLSQGTMLMIDWQAPGLAASYVNFSGFFVWDPQTQSGTPYLAVTGLPGTVIDPRNADWAKDGSKVAYWVHQCLVQRGLGACERGQSLLYVTDLVQNKTGIVAVAIGDQGAQFLALSPDGSRVAYLFKDRIYWQSTALP